AHVQPGALVSRADGVRRGHTLGPQRNVLRVNERVQPEYRHEPLPSFEMAQVGIALPWATTAEIVEDVVTVRRNTQLTQPGEDHRRRSLDRNRAVGASVWTRDQRVARHGRCPF